MEYVHYFNIEDGVLEQLSVTEVKQRLQSPNFNTYQAALGLQLGIQYHIASLLEKHQSSPPKAAPKKSYYKKKTGATNASNTKGKE